MTHTLLHKNLPVADLDFDTATDSIGKVTALYHSDHLPVGVAIRKGVVDRAALNQWWADRSIPSTRDGLVSALQALGHPDAAHLLEAHLGLSLTEHYWLKPQGSSLAWEDVNFFQNSFSSDVGDALLGKPIQGSAGFRSPDWTCDGNLRKRWAIMDGKRCLIKAGSQPFQQQPFGEVIASKIAERLGIPHIPYTVIWDEGLPYSVCEDFVTPDTELIPAWRVMQTQKKDNQTSVYRHYRNCCEKLGIPNVARALDQMLVLDYLIANEDRHFNNFGLLRNPDTLEWLGQPRSTTAAPALGTTS